MTEPQTIGEPFSDESFWLKLRASAAAAGGEVVGRALGLYRAATDAGTPVWVKGTIIAALGYFICPLDTIPDIVPLLGFADDLGVLSAAAAAVAAHVRPPATEGQESEQALPPAEKHVGGG